MMTPSNPPKMRELIYFKLVIWRMRFWLAIARLCMNLRWGGGADYALAREEHLLAIFQRWRQIIAFR
jgi:hypothetical protein